LLVEPALAAWDYEPAHETWLKRLRDPACPLRELLLAAECLGRVRESAAVEPLLGIVHDPLRPGDVRLAAARAAGAIRDAGLETDAVRLNATGSAAILPRLCAVALLQRHGSSAAQDQLLQLARDDEPAVIAAAMGRLLEIDPALVLPLAEQALQNRDANVRQRGVDAYVALPTPERVASLAARLDDVHPGIRGHVRDALFRLAERAELDMPIRQGAMRVLHDESWRGQEQAALLLGALDHKPAAARFVALLDAPRPEVMETVAWGLRKLAVPETVPAIFERVSHLTEYRLRSDISPPPRLDQQVAHLCEALGVLRHQSAEPLMRRYVAKNYRMGEASRCAAIWTLGHLHAGTPDEALAKELMQRVTDTNPLQPEYISVQRMSAVSLGRMKAVSQAAALREWLGAEADKGIGDPAFMWAVTQLTGETFPEPEPPTIGMSGWFLEPLPKLSPPTPAP
jgi:HEAT repeat protein